jgi:hypothetical protein
MRGKARFVPVSAAFDVLINEGRIYRFWAHGERVGSVPKLVWRVKLVAELRAGVVTETEVARIERDEQADLADLGLRLTEMKQLTAALQAEIVPAQVAMVGELDRCCSSWGACKPVDPVVQVLEPVLQVYLVV